MFISHEAIDLTFAIDFNNSVKYMASCSDTNNHMIFYRASAH